LILGRWLALGSAEHAGQRPVWSVGCDGWGRLGTAGDGSIGCVKSAWSRMSWADDHSPAPRRRSQTPRHPAVSVAWQPSLADVQASRGHAVPGVAAHGAQARGSAAAARSADSLVGGRMGCQQPLRPSAGRTVAVMQCVKCGGQLPREAVVGGEAVGGDSARRLIAASARGQSTAASPTKASTPRPSTGPGAVSGSRRGPVRRPRRSGLRAGSGGRPGCSLDRSAGFSPRARARSATRRAASPESLPWRDGQLVHQHGHQLVLR
jgi:hypothetical protein